MITITGLGAIPSLVPWRKPIVKPAAGSFTTAPAPGSSVVACPDGSTATDPSLCPPSFTTNPAGPASSTQPPATVTCPDGSTATDISLCPSGYVPPTVSLCPDGVTYASDPSTCPQPTAGTTTTISPGPVAVTSSGGAPALVPVVGFTSLLPPSTGLSPLQMFGLAALGVAVLAGVFYAVKRPSSRSRTASAI